MQLPAIFYFFTIAFTADIAFRTSLNIQNAICKKGYFHHRFSFFNGFTQIPKLL